MSYNVLRKYSEYSTEIEIHGYYSNHWKVWRATYHNLRKILTDARMLFCEPIILFLLFVVPSNYFLKFSNSVIKYIIKHFHSFKTTDRNMPSFVKKEN